jgi:hypothetical protein
VAFQNHPNRGIGIYCMQRCQFSFFTNMSVGYHSKYRNVMSLTKLSNGNFLAINAWPDSEYIELTELISPGYTDTIKNSFKVPLFSPAGYSKDFNFNCNMTIPSP